MTPLMTRRSATVVGLLLIALAVPRTANSQTVENSYLTCAKARAVDAAVRREMAKQRAVGVAVGIVRNGQVVYIRGYGYEDRERRVPVTSGTMFRWASISKTLTAIAAMQLVERGRLDLTADVRKYVPEFPERKGVCITPRDLLCHQSGVVHYKNGKVVRTKRKYQSPHPFTDVLLALDTFKKSPLICQPGAKYSYTTHGYILLSAVVQRAGKRTFAEQIAQRIAEPLKLTTLQPDYQWEPIADRAVGYRLRGGCIIRSTNTDVSWKLGGGGFISSIEDLAKYAAGLINGRLISKQTARRMWVRQKTRDGKPTRYGLGFRVSRIDGRLAVSHNGSQEKTKTRLVIFPQQRRGIVVMSNSEYANPTAFTRAIDRVLSNP